MLQTPYDTISQALMLTDADIFQPILGHTYLSPWYKITELHGVYIV